jgi:hypothetical protein
MSDWRRHGSVRRHDPDTMFATVRHDGKLYLSATVYEKHLRYETHVVLFSLPDGGRLGVAPVPDNTNDALPLRGKERNGGAEVSRVGVVREALTSAGYSRPYGGRHPVVWDEDEKMLVVDLSKELAHGA